MTTKCLRYDVIMIWHVNDGYEICYGTRYVIIDMFMIWYIVMRYVMVWYVHDENCSVWKHGMLWYDIFM